MTLKEHVALFPLLSIASQITSVTPMINSDPDDVVQLITGSSSVLSVTVRSSQITSAVGLPRSVGDDMFAGHAEIRGASLSSPSSYLTSTNNMNIQ